MNEDLKTETYVTVCNSVTAECSTYRLLPGFFVWNIVDPERCEGQLELLTEDITDLVEQFNGNVIWIRAVCEDGREMMFLKPVAIEVINAGGRLPCGSTWYEVTIPFKSVS